MIFWPGTASAHAFLVTTNPEAGSRLSVAPPLLTLRFSEAVNLADSRISVTVLGQVNSLPLELKGPRVTIRANLPATESGIYEVNWQTSSSDDGHVTEGNFAFAVGSVTGSIPGVATHSPAPNTVLVAANWLFFVGLALAAGGLVTALFVDRSVAPQSTVIRVAYWRPSVPR
ncbi:MAG: copper resistance protein CopC [Acidimicrobiales bacterium]|nr:copper resistance protein CopC [Acidimicrobiales bacterium]